MKPDQERLQVLLVDTIALLCKTGLTYNRDLRVQGLLGITVDTDEVFVVQLDEKIFTDGRASGGANSIPHPVLLSKVMAPPSPPPRATRGTGRRGRPPLANRPSPSKRKRVESDFVTPPGNGVRNSHVSVASSAISKSSAQQDMNHTDGYETGMADVSFESPFPDFSTPPYAAATAENETPGSSGSEVQKNKKKILKPPPDTQTLPSEDHQPLYDVSINNQWNNDDAQDEESAAYHIWDCMAANIKQEVPDETFNNSWMSNNSGSHNESHNESRQTPRTANKSEASGSETKKVQRRRRHGDDDEKTFVCQYESCDKAFYRKDHLVRHQRQKHGKPFNSDTKLVYYCHDPDCAQMFYQVSRLRKHIEECHPNLGMTAEGSNSGGDGLAE